MCSSKWASASLFRHCFLVSGIAKSLWKLCFPAVFFLWFLLVLFMLFLLLWPSSEVPVEASDFTSPMSSDNKSPYRWYFDVASHEEEQAKNDFMMHGLFSLKQRTISVVVWGWISRKSSSDLAKVHDRWYAVWSPSPITSCILSLMLRFFRDRFARSHSSLSRSVNRCLIDIKKVCTPQSNISCLLHLCLPSVTLMNWRRSARPCYILSLTKWTRCHGHLFARCCCFLSFAWELCCLTLGISISVMMKTYLCCRLEFLAGG